MGTCQSHTLNPASSTILEPDPVVSTSLSRRPTLTKPFSKPTDRLACDVWTTLLPDNPWIKILSYLDQKDRLAVSRTCWRLHQLCLQEPCLWRSLSITIGADYSKKRRKVNKRHKLKLDRLDESALKHCISSRGVQDLEILFKNVSCLKVSSKTHQLLTEASRNWPLRKVTISCENHRGVVPISRLMPQPIKDLLINCLTSPMARHIEKLYVRSWNWWDEERRSVLLQVLKDASCGDNLKELRLNWVTTTSTFPHPSLADCRAVQTAVARFTCLQRLSLQTPYLTDSCLDTLSGALVNAELLVLTGGFFIQDLKEEGWVSLLRSSPDLKVHLVGQSILICETIRRALPACVPLTSFSWCLERATDLTDRDQQRQVLQLLPRYAAHLQTVRVDETQVEAGQELVSLVRHCPKLKELRFGGKVKAEIILTLAALPRQWTWLRFVDKAIMVGGDPSHRDQEMARLREQVSRYLGKPWVPLSSALSRGAPALEDQTSGKRTIGLDVRPQGVSV